MSLSTTAAKVVLSGNGATTVWPYTFPIPDTASLQVYFTDSAGVQTLLSSTLYSVTGINAPGGGNVTYPLSGSPIASGTKLTIARVVDYTQSTVFTNQGGYFPQVTESRFDRTMMAIQQLVDRSNRSLAVPISDATNPADLPSSTARANGGAGSVLGFDGSGNPFAAVLTGSLVAASTYIVTNLLPAISASAARLALGFSSFINGLATAADASAARATLGAIGAVRVQKFTSPPTTVTMTIASPAVLSWTAHGLPIGGAFQLTTTGALPTGVSANTTYFVIAAGYGANSFQFSATSGGTAIITTGSQSGTHTGTPFYVPSTTMVSCILETWGGGGGGGGCATGAGSVGAGAGGGGGGGYGFKGATPTDIGASKAVTIGGSGAGGSAGNNVGGPGGTTSVGSLCTAGGGAGGGGSAGNSTAAGGSGGNPGTGDDTWQGGAGGVGSSGSAPVVSGAGGASRGPQTPGVISAAAAAGNNGLATSGAGGSGGASYNAGGAVAGGAGGTGYVKITEFCTS